MTQPERKRKARGNWEKLVSKQGRSGQSVSASCPERRLCASHFFSWKERLRAAGSEAGRTTLPKLMEVKMTPAWPESAGAGSTSRAEVVVRPAADPPPPAMGGWKWCCGTAGASGWGRVFDAELVRALLAVVEGAA